MDDQDARDDEWIQLLRKYALSWTGDARPIGEEIVTVWEPDEHGVLRARRVAERKTRPS